MSKCSFPSPSFVQTFRVTTKKEENHISTEFLRMMEIVKFNIPPSLTSVSTTSLNAKAFKSKHFRRLTFDTRSYLIPAQCMVPTFYIWIFGHVSLKVSNTFAGSRFSRYEQLFQAWASWLQDPRWRQSGLWPSWHPLLWDTRAQWASSTTYHICAFEYEYNQRFFPLAYFINAQLTSKGCESWKFKDEYFWGFEYPKSWTFPILNYWIFRI